MDKKSLERNYRKIEDCVLQGKLKDALDMLKDLVLNSKKGEFVTQYDNLDDTYENLLKYSIEGVNDPERENIYNRLLVSVLELADVALQSAYMNESDQYIYRLKKKIEFDSKQVKEDALDSIENLLMDKALSDVLKSSLDTGQDELAAYKQHQELILRIFNLVWLTDKFNDSDQQILDSIWSINQFPWHEKAILISALTVSTLRCFDKRKIMLMIKFALDEEAELRQRALVGLFVILYQYNHRLKLYPDLLEEIKVLQQIENIGMHLEMIAIQMIKSQETEKITKKLHDEILPEMVKYQPVLRDKLDLDNILSSDFMDDKNPDWETVFEDAPDLLDKLQEISRLQMEGADVFMSTFARLKHFEFFNHIINWFKPFYPENAYIRHALKGENEKFDTGVFLDGLSKSFFMCNSDKYSFSLNITQMPDLQKNMLLEMFHAEIESIEELQKEDDILNKPAHTKSIYSQYIQDLYRFYKLHPLRHEFLDIFTLRFHIQDCHFAEILIDDNDIYRNIAEFFFENGNFESALGLYGFLNAKGNNSMEIFEKMGYCYQRLKKYEEALDFYKRAELFDANRAWNLRKIALCYRYLKNYEKSLSYYLEAEKLDPENLYVQTYIGHSYLDLKQFDKALEYYYKVEFMADENRKVLRPIAWCSFVLGKLDTAKKYLEKIIEAEANKFDYINLGHVEWCIGNRKSAVRNYKLSINRSDNNLKLFLSSFEEDKQYLIKNGIDQKEIPLLLDYLKYQL
ncbi:MAG: tetratricopeptide repeat protein [Bacteroidales bacterium]|nr:tetratricopeptide repeat protein [Bacteroidales bacterium]